MKINPDNNNSNLVGDDSVNNNSCNRNNINNNLLKTENKISSMELLKMIKNIQNYINIPFEDDDNDLDDLSSIYNRFSLNINTNNLDYKFNHINNNIINNLNKSHDNGKEKIYHNINPLILLHR